MDDLKTNLERLANRMDERDVSLERLERARDRRNRNRRITAGVLAVTVALAGTLTAVAAFRDQPGTTAVDGGQNWQPPDTLTVWPESPVTGPSPADVQTAVDAGDPDLRWRLDPLTVSQRFARGILGWVDVDTIPVVTQNGTAKVVTIVPCPSADACRPIGTLDLTLVQPATQGEGGIWSVHAVTSRDLAVEVGVMDPEAGLAGGSSWRFDLTVPGAVSAHIGMAAANGCRTATAFDAALSSGTHQLTLPRAKEADPSCGRIGAGYLFAYATDDTTIPTPDPLTEPTAIEFPWMTIVPIYLEMETGPTATATESTAVSGAESALLVRCADGGTDVPDAVTAQRDGVHISYGGPFPMDLKIDRKLYRTGDYSPLVLDLAPGNHAIQCIPPAANVIEDPQPFDVVDPNGYWVDPTLDCERYAHTDFDAGGITVEGDPTDELQAAAVGTLEANLDTTVSVGPGGYAERSDERVYVATDADGHVVGAMYFSRGDAGWYPDGYSTCEINAIF